MSIGFNREPKRLRTEESVIQSFNNQEAWFELHSNNQQNSLCAANGAACGISSDVYEDVDEDEEEDYENSPDKMHLQKGSSVRYTTSPTYRLSKAGKNKEQEHNAFSSIHGHRNYGMDDQDIYENTTVQDEIYQNP